jgi:hypothetical protein
MCDVKSVGGEGDGDRRQAHANVYIRIGRVWDTLYEHAYQYTYDHYRYQYACSGISIHIYYDIPCVVYLL